MMDSDLKAGIAVIVGGIIVIFSFICIGELINIKFVDNVPSVVKVDGNVVYEGTSAGFDIESSGANTTVTIKEGFLYWFPKAYYTSDKIEIVGRKS